jgi:hypothetical protein
MQHCSSPPSCSPQGTSSNRITLFAQRGRRLCCVRTPASIIRSRRRGFATAPIGHAQWKIAVGPMLDGRPNPDPARTMRRWPAREACPCLVSHDAGRPIEHEQRVQPGSASRAHTRETCRAEPSDREPHGFCNPSGRVAIGMTAGRSRSLPFTDKPKRSAEHRRSRASSETPKDISQPVADPSTCKRSSDR